MSHYGTKSTVDQRKRVSEFVEYGLQMLPNKVQVVS